ncbi:surfeit locus protein 6-like protein [Trichonephila clavata]|uniref:Surfeit locus protein 6-like protein n=1 Tax=Trichonephila clavata TaxID=2740835 RepID=A0A8X6HS67_TRICU|nr:surfeit locus protein 6-like protein [Trichonephila clavata]
MAALNGGNSDPNMHIIQEITEEDRYLLNLVDTIPAKVYFNQAIQEKIKYDKHLTMDQKAESMKRKFSNKIELSAKIKHKRARVDPLCQKSVSQIHKEMSKKLKKESKRNKKGILPSASLTRVANIEELQKRLQERITELQAKRKSSLTDGPSKKRLKMKEKKLKHKVASTQVKKEETQTKKLNQNQSEEKPKYNKEGKIIYGKLDFSEGGMKDKKRSEFSGKNYKNLLKMAEQKKNKIEKLKEVNPEKAASIEEKERWKKAILKAENVKVKDDPNLLKKSLKKKEKIKMKKAKEWNERVEHTEAKKKARQEKRTKNIQKRKQQKLDNKVKRAKKKGRVIPGF